MTVSRSIEYSLGDSGPSLRIAPDLRRQAGFDPALVIDIHVPSASPDVVFAGPAKIERAGSAMDTHPEKAYVITLTASRRTDDIKPDSLGFKSLAADAATVYKLFFRLNPAEACVLHLPDILWGEERISVPKILLETAERTQPVCLREQKQ